MLGHSSASHVTIIRENIPISSKVINLGVILDNTLSTGQTVSQVRKVCLLELRRIRQIRRFIDEDRSVDAVLHLLGVFHDVLYGDEEVTKRLVIAFIISRIDYRNSLFKEGSHEKIKRLQGIQNQKAKLVRLAHKSNHVTPILKDLHWLPVQSRIDYKILTLVFQSMQDSTFPEYLKQMIETYLPERSLRSKTKNLLKKQRTKLKTFGDRSFYFTAPELWNSLPQDILNSSSLSAFKQNLKTHLFRCHFIYS